MRTLIATSTALILALATTGHAAAPSLFHLTGTWTGKGSCAGLVEGEKLSSPMAVTVEITQTGADEIAAEFVFSGTGKLPVLVTLEGCGFVEPEAAKPERGRGAVHGYSEAEPFALFGTADISKASTFDVDSKGRSGKLKGTALLAVRDMGDAIVSCKFAVDRFSQVDPVLPSCGTAPAIAAE